jgi:hypothetical protein
MSVAELAPIGLDELIAGAGLLDRVDRKYVVPVATLERLIDALRPSHRLLTVGDRTTFDYRSTYFDTPDLALFRAHVQGRRRRFKCRTRLYLDSGLHAFEVKLKGPRDRTVKHRLTCPELPAGPLADPARGFMERCLAEHYDTAIAEELHPSLTVAYRRVTLAAPERDERVTYDVALRFLGPDGRGGRLADGLAVVESKSLDGRATADRVLGTLGVRPVANCSKYCLGVGLTRPGARANRLRPLLRRHFEVCGAARP